MNKKSARHPISRVADEPPRSVAPGRTSRVQNFPAVQRKTLVRRSSAGNVAAQDALQLRSSADWFNDHNVLAAMGMYSRDAPVQTRGGVRGDSQAIHEAAARGTSDSGTGLPHFNRIQESFGSHDVGGITAHVGDAAQEACDEMGALAYASGENVAFRGQPDLYTAAHEAAHVVQQRSGVQLQGGVGQIGDAYERHADDVADRVVRGESAQSLLDQKCSSESGAATTTIQRQVAQSADDGNTRTEEIFVVGGEEDAGRSYGNFMWALDLRLKEIEEVEPNTKLTVMFFKEPYEERAVAEGNPVNYYTGAESEIRDIVSEHEERLDTEIEIVMVDSNDEFFNYINTGAMDGESNTRDQRKIKNWEYFGHGLSDSLGVEYNYDPSDATAEGIALEDIERFDPSAFAAFPEFKSWACNTATEDWLKTYREHVGGSAVGANNLTEYGETYYPWWDSTPERLPYPVNGGQWVEEAGHGARVVASNDSILAEDPEAYRDTRVGSLAAGTMVELISKGEGEDFNKYDEQFHWWKVRVLDGDCQYKVGWIMQTRLNAQ